jgi:hypothetical protein
MKGKGKEFRGKTKKKKSKKRVKLCRSKNVLPKTMRRTSIGI